MLLQILNDLLNLVEKSLYLHVPEDLQIEDFGVTLESKQTWEACDCIEEEGRFKVGHRNFSQFENLS